MEARMLSLDKDRQHMIEHQLAHRGLRNADVLRAMQEAPREAFVPEELQSYAYKDMPLPIDAGQTISQPYAAAERLRRLGYDNVDIRTGDGAHGWLEAASFDAILVSASGEAIPQALEEQLEIGGALVMPVGAAHGAQRLIKMQRTGANSYEEEDLGAVSFVPLITGES
jgi:protein-L-isoaspartate O-methyltransferase